MSELALMSELGMDRRTGQVMSGTAHIIQSLAHILGTRRGTRGGYRRHYGSRVPDLVDTQIAPGNLVVLYAEVAQAVAEWEDRVELARVTIRALGQSKVCFALQGTIRATGEPLDLAVEVSA